MSNLRYAEKEKLEKLFGMSSGYVLGFEYRSNFQSFIKDSIGIDIEENKYLYNEKGSMANRLRKLWEVESDQLVGKLVDDLLNYISDKNSNLDQKLFEQCRKTAERLLHLESLEFDLESEKELSVLTNSIKDSIRNGIPEAGLDRLHTYAVKFIRKICSKRRISLRNSVGEKPLHSLMGEYIKDLEKNHEVDSETTKRILKSAISIFESFNSTRNDESLAHDNPILNKDESLLILKYVTATLAFIRIIEQRKIDNFKISKDLPNRLRSQILVSEVVKRKVILKERNQQFIGLCPFHNEKTPSFTVNNEKEFYHCFGCGAHGDVISFLMNDEQIDYKTAVMKLVDEFSISEQS